MNVRSYLALIIIMIVTCKATAQDIFEQGFYAPKLVIKYKDKIKLSDDQLGEIKTLYNKATEGFKVKKERLNLAMKLLQTTLKSSGYSSEEAIEELEKVNSLELEIKKIKLSTLIAVKNSLTSVQQDMLNKYKEENSAMIKAFDLSISEQGSQVIVRLRGDGTAETQPLFILKKNKRELTQNEIDNLDADKIESIEVLKGESATKIYGKKGENGVVIIQMKQNK